MEKKFEKIIGLATAGLESERKEPLDTCLRSVFEAIQKIEILEKCTPMTERNANSLKETRQCLEEALLILLCEYTDSDVQKETIAMIAEEN